MTISDEEISKGMATINAIWLAMIGSLAVYLFVGLRVGPGLHASLGRDSCAVLRWILYAVALVDLIGTWYLRKSLLSKRPKARVPQTSAVVQNPVVQKYVSAMVVVWALSASIAIAGLLLFFLGKNTTDLYVLVLVAAAAMLVHRPKKDDLMALFERDGEAPAAHG